jgi:hypothetical protein
MVGRGRASGVTYEMRPGSWRDFAERLNPSRLNESKLTQSLQLPVQGFVAEFGPLVFTTPPRQPFNIGLWFASRQLLTLARLWSPPDDEGRSAFCGTAEPGLEEEAAQTIHQLHAHLGDPLVRPPAGSLLGFLLMEALRFTAQQLPMRKCGGCRQWFAPTRIDQRHCQPNCRKRWSHKLRGK